MSLQQTIENIWDNRDLLQNEDSKTAIREVISKALQHFAAGLICLHNHPSGDPTPSREDRVFTQNLLEAGKIMQIRILDHIIIGDGKYHSFADHGEM